MALQRRRAVHVGRRAVGLERVDADLARRMQIVPWFGEQGWDMTGGALAGTVEDRLPPLECSFVIGPNWGLRRRHRELIEMQRGQLGRNPVRLLARVPRAALRRDRILV